MVKKVYAFDFDGTLTTKDTLLEFIRFARGNTAFLFGFLLFSKNTLAVISFVTDAMGCTLFGARLSKIRS